MKVTRKCPKCGGTEIYTDDGMTKRGDRASIPISSWHKLFIAIYLCKKCGYFEEYIEEDQLQNEKKMEKLAENWRKLK